MRQCAASGEPFQAGQGIVSYLLQGKDEYVRVDVRSDAAEGFTLPGLPLCRWTWELRRLDNPERDAARNALAQSEELFLALCHADDAGDLPSVALERAALRHLLGLMLQRKRLLRPLRGQGHRFLHVPSGEEVLVPPVQMTEELARRVAPMIVGQ